jgi:hypothetical protein
MVLEIAGGILLAVAVLLVLAAWINSGFTQ